MKGFFEYEALRGPGAFDSDAPMEGSGGVWEVEGGRLYYVLKLNGERVSRGRRGSHEVIAPRRTLEHSDL